MVTRAELILAGKDQTAAMFASASRGFDGLKRQAAAVQTGVAAVGTTLAGAFALVGAKGAIDTLDMLDDLQEKTGISVEKLSELRFAGEAVGTPFEVLAGGVGRLSKLMAEAASGNKEAAATFKALNVEVKNSDGTLRSQDQVLGDLADRFASYSDGPEKAADAQRLFGKSGQEMIPLLNQGRDGIEKLRLEAEQLGAIYSGPLAKDAADFNDNLTKLKLSSEAAAIAVGGPLLKSLVAITNQILEAKKEGGLLNAVLIAMGGGVARTLGVDEIGQAQSRARAAIGEMTRLQSQMNGVELQLQRDPTNEMAQRRLATYRSKIEEQQRIATAASADLKRLADVADPNGSAQKRKEDRGFTPVIPDNRGAAPVIGDGGAAGKKAKDDEAAAKRYIDSLTKQKEKVKELSQVEISLAEIQRIRTAGGEITDAQQQQILTISAEIDHLKEVEELKKKADEDQKERQRRLFAEQDEAKRLYQETLTPLEAYNAAVAHLNDLRRDGLITSETYARAISKEGDEFTAAEKRLRELGSQTDEFSKQAAENIQDSLGRGLSDALDGNFKDIGKNFLKMLRDMVAQAAAARISRAMFGDLVKGGEGDGIFSQLLRTAGGALLGGGGGGYTPAQQAGLDGLITGLAGVRADGGPVAAGKAYLVGERGHEVFVPKSDGTIVPNHELGRNGSLTVNNLTSGRVDIANLDRTPQGDVLTIRQVDDYMSRQIANPNSQFSKALAAHTGASRKRD
jgi:lambda family phage tail tape measure protein